MRAQKLYILNKSTTKALYSSDLLQLFPCTSVSFFLQTVHWVKFDLLPQRSALILALLAQPQQQRLVSITYTVRVTWLLKKMYFFPNTSSTFLPLLIQTHLSPTQTQCPLFFSWKDITKLRGIKSHYSRCKLTSTASRNTVFFPRVQQCTLDEADVFC